jgi:hypothetical protein
MMKYLKVHNMNTDDDDDDSENEAEDNMGEIGEELAHRVVKKKQKRID